MGQTDGNDLVWEISVHQVVWTLLKLKDGGQNIFLIIFLCVGSKFMSGQKSISIKEWRETSLPFNYWLTPSRKQLSIVFCDSF